MGNSFPWLNCRGVYNWTAFEFFPHLQTHIQTIWGKILSFIHACLTVLFFPHFSPINASVKNTIGGVKLLSSSLESVAKDDRNCKKEKKCFSAKKKNSWGVANVLFTASAKIFHCQRRKKKKDVPFTAV